MILLVKPAGRGFRLITRMEIGGGHMDRAIVFRAGQLFSIGGIKWRVCQVLP